MRELSWAETVRRVHQRADNRCEYYQTAQRVMGQVRYILQKPRRLSRFPQHLKTQDFRYYPSGCHSFVMVMQTAHFRQLADCPRFR